ncbi:MAG: patatin-like phospholipase family protein, partial [Cytophagales bacterium]|nr:patatin-like phospholipase family protein [Cytophagales bacterium]
SRPASILLLFTLGVLFAGAMNFWLRRWAGTALVGLLLALNLLVRYQVIQSDYAAFGLDYSSGKASYDVGTLTRLSATALVQADADSTRAILDRWRTRFPAGAKPRMILVCTSGGGQRAALWTMRSLQVADQMLAGRLMQHTVLMTGASGGAVGASYFRELYLRRQKDPAIDPHAETYLHNMGCDNLNAIAFTMVVNDLLFKFGRFDYKGHRYVKDRGYAFEQQLNRNTKGLLDKPLIAYREPERLAQIPMLLLAPTIVNDGRKLYISPQPLSYMSAPLPILGSTEGQKIKGVEFRRFFADQDADSLRFLSGLRMNATFPYITPNVSLPSTPAMEIMDAGLSDNFGVSDAVRFLYVFRQWIGENTSGVILLSIRDTPKEHLIEQNTDLSLWDKVSTPVGSLYRNWSHLQDIQNDNSVQYAGRWLPVPLLQADLTYDAAAPVPTADTAVGAPNGRKGQRASLSWRLTEREKAGIRQAIHNDPNQATIRQLQAWLAGDHPKPEIRLTQQQALR